MTSLAVWLKKHPWAVFLLHQVLLFFTALAFLSSVRGITGRSIHLGRDPVGLVDGVALVVLSVAAIFLTRALYRWAKGKDAPPLGIAFSFRRLAELVAGLLLGAVFLLLPWILALWAGTAAVTDRIDAHFDFYSVIRIVTVAFILLFAQGVMEEVTNRAFPMRLWEHRSLLFRLILPSIFFAALHLADEQFTFERIGVLFAFGVILGLAYALTGNIWFASGVHAGANCANFSISGLWHAGAVVNIAGQPFYPNWVGITIMLVFFILGLILKRHLEKEPPRPSGTPPL